MLFVNKILFIFSLFFVLTEQVDKITYPKVENEYPEVCSLTTGGLGNCRKFCIKPLYKKELKTTQICYFRDNEAYYCCNDNEIFAKIDDRPAIKHCDRTPLFEIVKGIDTEPNEYPYMVALGWPSLFGSNAYDYKCGGVLITRKFILTAAHCTHVNGLQPIVALIGGINLSTNRTDTIFNITKVIAHPEYKSSSVYHDIALIELEEDTLVSSIPCIWTRTDLENTNLTAVGYGQTEFAGATSNKLLKAYFELVSQENCQKFYKSEEHIPQGIQNTQLCAKDPAQIRDTCQGDSGGPLIMTKYFENFPKPQIVGITSFGEGCALSPPGVYTRISAYVDWIEGIVWPTNK